MIKAKTRRVRVFAFYDHMVQFIQKDFSEVIGMMKRVITLTLLLLFIFQGMGPIQCLAFETRRVVLVGPVDTARYQSPEIDHIIQEQWKRVFRYPYYEIIAEIHIKGKLPDKALLARLTREHDADIALATEIVRLRDITYSRGFWDDETWQEIDLELKVSTYTRSGEQQSFVIKRMQSQPLSINSGAAPLLSDAMDEALAKAPFKRIPNDR